MNNRVVVIRVNGNEVIGVIKAGNMKATIIRKFSSYSEAVNFWDRCLAMDGVVSKIFFEEF